MPNVKDNCYWSTSFLLPMKKKMTNIMETIPIKGAVAAAAAAVAAAAVAYY
jgi:hypothetical protein